MNLFYRYVWNMCVHNLSNHSFLVQLFHQQFSVLVFSEVVCQMIRHVCVFSIVHRCMLNCFDLWALMVLLDQSLNLFSNLSLFGEGKKYIKCYEMMVREVIGNKTYLFKNYRINYCFLYMFVDGYLWDVHIFYHYPHFSSISIYICKWMLKDKEFIYNLLW